MTKYQFRAIIFNFNFWGIYIIYVVYGATDFYLLCLVIDILLVKTFYEFNVDFKGDDE